MPLHAFISYSHVDEKHLERLHKHMAMLQRDGTIDDWSDHQIVPGDNVGREIDKSLARSSLFIALVSPDYLASNYCYEKEFQWALELAAGGTLRIVPVILEPCDWLSSPFSQFLALPKDGKAISEWANHNVAYLDVIKGLRRVAEADTPAASATDSASTRGVATGATRRLKIKQEFDAIQRSDFADEAFSAIRDYFRSSCGEISGVEDLRAKFESMSDTAFTCTIVNRGMTRGRGEAHITVRNDKGRNHFGDISYVYEAHAEPGTSNGSIRVEADDYNMYLTMNDFMSREDAKYDAQQAAEALWLDFVKQAGIDYA